MPPSAEPRIPTVETELVDIPDTQLKVSRVALGTWAMGGWMWGGTDQRESVATIHAALHQGINLIDTAPAYGFGVSEEIVGAALQGMRSDAVVATKVGLEWRDGKVYRNATRARIMQEIEDSLRRLRTDYIDIYQVHWPDPLVPVEETAEAMRSLYEQGKIRAIGVSNFSVSQMERFRQVAPLHVLQAPYNLFERAIEADVFPYAQRHGFAMLAYGSLCRGLLSGRMTADTQFPASDLRSHDPKFKAPHFAEYVAAVSALDRFAQQHFGKRVIHLALRWVLDRSPNTIALWGARHPAQLDPVGEVSGWKLDAAAMKAIDQIVDEHVRTPIGPEFMAPPERVAA
jgi:aryl-alcohol dehydrogenase-like predicted oxidoreductase